MRRPPGCTRYRSPHSRSFYWALPPRTVTCTLPPHALPTAPPGLGPRWSTVAAGAGYDEGYNGVSRQRTPACLQTRSAGPDEWLHWTALRLAIVDNPARYIFGIIAGMEHGTRKGAAKCGGPRGGAVGLREDSRPLRPPDIVCRSLRGEDLTVPIRLEIEAGWQVSSHAAAQVTRHTRIRHKRHRSACTKTDHRQQRVWGRREGGPGIKSDKTQAASHCQGS